MVSFLKHIGWDAEGIEFNSHAAQVGQDSALKIIHGSIEALECRNEYYDSIITSHCVEHVSDIKRLFNPRV